MIKSMDYADFLIVSSGARSELPDQDESGERIASSSQCFSTGLLYPRYSALLL
jgi:hypothetical protein